MPSPKKFTVREDVVIKNNSDFEILGDLYQPDGVQKAPMVLVIHGGGWRSRSGDMSALCEDLAEQGFLAFNVTYRLAPDHRYPAALEDVQAAKDFFVANADQWGGDKNNLFMWGYSAGGHLALLLGMQPSSGVKGIVAGGTPTDLSAYPRSPLIFKFLGKTFAEAPELWKKASPVTYVSKEVPPIFLYHGANDWLVKFRDAENLHKKLQAAGAKSELYRVEWLGHMFVYLFSVEAVDRGIDFIKRQIS